MGKLSAGHLNLKWSLGDIDRFVAAYNKGASRKELALTFRCTEAEIDAFVTRNIVHLRPLLRGM